MSNRILCIIIGQLEPGVHSKHGSVKYKKDKDGRTITKAFRNTEERLNFDKFQCSGRDQRNPNLVMMRVGWKRDYWYECEGV